MLSVRTLQPVRSKVAVPARATRGVAAPRSVVVRASLRESQGATVALASTAAMLLLSFGAADAAVAESFGKDPVSALVAQTQKIQDVKTKPGICDRKACKIYPGDDGFICRVYRPKGTEYKFEGKTMVASSGAFQRVDCDMILENP